MPLPLSAADLSGLRWVLTDIDDTLTTEGRLPPEAFAALHALDRAGIGVIPVTGRPAGWCDAIARQWPVRAVVGENGALWYAEDRAARRMLRHQAQDEVERLANRARLMDLAAQAMAAHPGSALAADQPFRLFDVAVDFAEDAGPLPLETARSIAAVFEAGGATAKVSSIHVNAWIGAWDKLSGLRHLFDTLLGGFEGQRGAMAYLGDSPNDAPMFAAVPVSIGVANVLPFLADMPSPPRYVTEASQGAGFAEFARALLDAQETRTR